MNSRANIWTVYRVPPIDTHWEQLRTVGETMAAIVAREMEHYNGEQGLSDECSGLLDAANQALREAVHIDWEGDFSQEMRVFWVPSSALSLDVCFEYGFVWKQDNNGSTFIASPIPLVGLGETASHQYRLRLAEIAEADDEALERSGIAPPYPWRAVVMARILGEQVERLQRLTEDAKETARRESDHCARAIGMAAQYCDRATMAEAIVAKLPKTADGVPIAPGMVLVSVDEGEAGPYEFRVKRIDGSGGQNAVVYGGNTRPGRYTSQCWSSWEAFSAAQEKNGNDKA